MLKFFTFNPKPTIEIFSNLFHIYKPGAFAFFSVVGNYLHETVLVAVRDSLIWDLLALLADNLCKGVGWIEKISTLLSWVTRLNWKD